MFAAETQGGNKEVLTGRGAASVVVLMADDFCGIRVVLTHSGEHAWFVAFCLG